MRTNSVFMKPEKLMRYWLPSGATSKVCGYVKEKTAYQMRSGTLDQVSKNGKFCFAMNKLFSFQFKKAETRGGFD